MLTLNNQDCYELEEIEITDMDIFQEAFGNISLKPRKCPLQTCLCGKNYNTKFSIINNMLCMVANPRKYKPFAFCQYLWIPLIRKNSRTLFFKLKEYFDSQDWKLFFGRVEECMVERFKKYLKVNIKAKKWIQYQIMFMTPKV